ncbi:hypothetical protein GCM10007052_27370 [Halioglobus japonicus]|nr:hypothetical protein GCM10007052_27370 [Halioglobus japonicus]
MFYRRDIYPPKHGGHSAGTVVIPAQADPRSPYGLVLGGESDEQGIELPPSGTVPPE